jgi:hypothetical protein
MRGFTDNCKYKAVCIFNLPPLEQHVTALSIMYTFVNYELQEIALTLLDVSGCLAAVLFCRTG